MNNSTQAHILNFLPGLFSFVLKVAKAYFKILIQQFFQTTLRSVQKLRFSQFKKTPKQNTKYRHTEMRVKDFFISFVFQSRRQHQPTIQRVCKSYCTALLTVEVLTMREIMSFQFNPQFFPVHQNISILLIFFSLQPSSLPLPTHLSNYFLPFACQGNTSLS